MAFNAQIAPTIDGVFNIKDSSAQLAGATKDSAKALQDAFNFGMKFHDWRRSNKSADMLEKNDENVKADKKAEEERSTKLAELQKQRKELNEQLAELKKQVEAPSTEEIEENVSNMPADEQNAYLAMNGMKDPMLTDRLSALKENPEFMFNWAK